jgi:hypothetical protein
MKANIKDKKCIVCGEPAVGWTGYIFYSNGKRRVGIPFCGNHIRKLGVEIANPIFENQLALELFREKHPDLYRRYVKDKKVIFLQKSQPVIESHPPELSIDVKPSFPTLIHKGRERWKNQEKSEKITITVSLDSFVLTKTGFKKIRELSLTDLVLGVKEPTKEFEWSDIIEVGKSPSFASNVRIITDKNEITIDANESVRIVQQDKVAMVKAKDVALGDLMEIHFLDKEFIKKEIIDKPHLIAQPKPSNLGQLFSNENVAYLLGVFNNIVEGLPGNLTLKVWSTDIQEIKEYGEKLQEIMHQISNYVCESTDIECNAPSSFRVEEGPRYSWLIYEFPDQIPIPPFFEILKDYALQGVVPFEIRTSGFKTIREYITGLLEVNIEFDEKWKTFRIALPSYKSEVIRFLDNFLNFCQVHSVIKEVFTPNNPWEINIYLDVSEVVKKCDILVHRPLLEQACDIGLGEYHKRETLYPKVRSITLNPSEGVCNISFKPLWNPLIEWTTIHP